VSQVAALVQNDGATVSAYERSYVPAPNLAGVSGGKPLNTLHFAAHAPSETMSRWGLIWPS
jgi:hypothetical protein